MNEQEQKDKIVKDIQDLKGELLNEATKEIKNSRIYEEAGTGKKWNSSERERQQKVKKMKSRLKELIGTFNIIEEAEKITGHEITGKGA